MTNLQIKTKNFQKQNKKRPFKLANKNSNLLIKENKNNEIIETGHIINEKDKKQSGIRTTFIGSKKFKDMETGKIVELDYVTKEVAHTLKGGWRRVYLENFMEVLTGLYSSGKKIEIIEYILDNLNSENQLCLTQEQVRKAINASPNTIVDTYKYLVECDFMKKIGSVYIVNPKFVCAFGSDSKNRNILISYQAKEQNQENEAKN